MEIQEERELSDPHAPTYRLTLRALPHSYGEPGPDVRLRRALKALLRVYRFRCVDLCEVREEVNQPEKAGKN